MVVGGTVVVVVDVLVVDVLVVDVEIVEASVVVDVGTSVVITDDGASASAAEQAATTHANDAMSRLGSSRRRLTRHSRYRPSTSRCWRVATTTCLDRRTLTP